MASDRRPFRVRYAEAAGAVRRRRATRLAFLLALFAIAAVVGGALVAP